MLRTTPELIIVLIRQRKIAIYYTYILEVYARRGFNKTCVVVTQTIEVHKGINMH
jgi:hypothetical protein